MKRNKLFIVLLSALLIFVNCTSSDKEKSVSLLLETIGVDAELQKSAKCMVILPQAGCSSCIEQVRGMVRPSIDTIYVVTCQSSKEFFLLMGKKLDELPNAYMDRERLSIELGLAKAVPVFYMLDNGKYVSHEPLRKKQEGEKDEFRLTNISVNELSADLGKMSLGEKKEITFILSNTGKQPLKISHIEMSCDCMDVNYKDKVIAYKDTLHLNVTNRPEEVGDFIREIYVYGNFVDAPLEITLRGTVEEKN